MMLTAAPSNSEHSRKQVERYQPTDTRRKMPQASRELFQVGNLQFPQSLRGRCILKQALLGRLARNGTLKHEVTACLWQLTSLRNTPFLDPSHPLPVTHEALLPAVQSAWSSHSLKPGTALQNGGGMKG